MAYTEDVKIELTGKEFETLFLAVNHGIDAVTEIKFEEKTTWNKKDTGEVVKKPTKKQIEDGKVVQSIDIQETFSTPVKTYNDRITSQMIDASLLVNKIHRDNIEKGIFVPQEDPQQAEVTDLGVEENAG